MTEDMKVTVASSAVQQLLEKAPDILRDEITAALTQATMLLEREVKERTPTSGAGTLRDSIGALPLEISGEAMRGGVGTSLSYAAPVEEGSVPHFPPVEPLAEWVRRKLGITDADEAKGIALSIARKIAAHGTEPAHMFKSAFEANQSQVNDMINAAIDRALARMNGG